jgi:hypothetical protein
MQQRGASRVQAGGGPARAVCPPAGSAGAGSGGCRGQAPPAPRPPTCAGAAGATQPRKTPRPPHLEPRPARNSLEPPRHSQHGGTPTSRADPAPVGAPRAAGRLAALRHTRSGRRVGREAPARRLARGARAGEQRCEAHPPACGRPRHPAPAAARALPVAGAPGAGAGRRWRRRARHLRGLCCGGAGAPLLAGGARPRISQVPGHGSCGGPAGLLPPAAGAGPGLHRCATQLRMCSERRFAQDAIQEPPAPIATPSASVPQAW